jgi:Uma2 family endonuclease
MTVETKFPLSRQELAEISTGLVRFPASFGEYWDLLEQAEYRADFFQNEIIAMSYESNPHSKIVTRLITLLSGIFPIPNFAIHDSNRPVYIEDCDSGKVVFNPDCCVVSEPPQLFEYKTGLDAETNPVLIVEVLSKSTYEYDFAEKLPCYKKIPSLRQIIFVDSRRVYVTIFNRLDDNGQWLNADFDQLESKFEIGGKPVILKEIYSHLAK